MKRAIALLGAMLFAFALAGCSSDFQFSDQYEAVSLTYDDNSYSSIPAEDCEYAYDEGQMTYLYSIAHGDLQGMGESYDVYRHREDEAATYLFVVPKPSVRDMTPYAFVLKKEAD